jgi:hypothetical protein
MPEPEQPTRPHEEIVNVVRPIRERIGGIVLASHDTPMATPVGVDAASHELARMRRDENLLPRL